MSILSRRNSEPVAVCPGSGGGWVGSPLKRSALSFNIFVAPGRSASALSKIS